MSIADKLQDLIEAKEDMKSAIESKGVPVSGGLSSYADYIRIFSSDKFILFDGMTLGYSELTDFSSFDFTRVNEYSNMFNNCFYMESVPNIDISRSKYLIGTFYRCFNIESIPDIDTAHIERMEGMFFSCIRLKTTPFIDMSSCTSIDNMFDNCTSLESVKFKGLPRYTLLKGPKYIDLPESGTIYYDSNYSIDYYKTIIDRFPSTWNTVPVNI